MPTAYPPAAGASGYGSGYQATTHSGYSPYPNTTTTPVGQGIFTLNLLIQSNPFYKKS